MVNRSEGVRRIVLLISVVATISWAVYVVIEVSGFSRKLVLNDWGIIIGGFLVTIFTAPIISKVVYWIIDGFSHDNST